MGPKQSEGPLPSERPPAIQGAPSNLRGPQQSEGPPAFWGAPSNPRGPQQSEGPSAIWRGPINLRGPHQSEGPQQSEGLPAIWGSDPWELLSFRSSFHPMLSTRSTIFEIAQLLVDYYALSSTFSYVCTAHILSLTLSVTVVTFERSFSKLKLIKNYLRSIIMSEKRLSDLALW